jgi:hypothetical protein
MFYKVEKLQPGELSIEKVARVELIEAGLPKSKIIEINRKYITVELSDGTEIVGDVAPSGFTVYLGGFDWVTFKTPSPILHKFPQFMPLPQAPLPPSLETK